MLWIFFITAVRLARIPAHHEGPARHPHQFEGHIAGQGNGLPRQLDGVADRHRFASSIAHLEVHRLRAAFGGRKREGRRRIVGLPAGSAEIGRLAGHVFRRPPYARVVQRHHGIRRCSRAIVDRKGSYVERCGQPEPDHVGSKVRQVIVTKSRAAILSRVPPGATPDRPVRGPWGVNPSAPVCRRARVTRVVVVIAPLPHVATHVIQPKRIHYLAAHGLAAHRAVVAVVPRVHLNRCIGQIVAPVEAGLRSCPACILPLCLAGQTHRQWSLSAAYNMRVQRRDEILRVVP
ncbi:MAG: hypothetical protein BWX80_00720 [Candidatus Hydrogenedentes bacterium ADurb.Bin101]|nr:MAG: hypothetical protein BWX80_00720 [Candidatus Hydrogenedentes bacterium ADurb.Bin101]